MNIKNITTAIFILALTPSFAIAERTSAPITGDNGVIACATCVTTTGAQEMTNKTITQPSLTVKQSAAPGPTAEGEMWWDTDDHVLLIGNGSGTTTVGAGGGGGGGSGDPAGSNMQVQYNDNDSFGGDADFTFNESSNTLGIPNISSPTSMSIQIDSDNNGTETFQFKNGAGTEICSIDESGNFQIDGDLTVSGDDLFMGTNTSGYILVADGTNFNPVAVSSDVAISSAGAVTIQANSVALGTDTTGAYVGSATSNAGLAVVGSDDAITIGISIGATPDDSNNGASGDSLITFDASDSNNVKRILVSELATLAADGDTVDMGSGFVIEDTDGDEITLIESKEMAILEGTGIDVNWTDTSTGSDGDPYDLTISINSDVVTLTGSQTLTNKTLTSPTINTATIGAPTSLTLTQGASVAPTAEGVIAWDTDDDTLKVGTGSGTVSIAAGGGGASALNDLSDATVGSASGSQILIYDGSNSFDNQTVGGDITIASNGTVTIGADKITTGMLNDASDSPSAGECLKVATTTSQIEYAACTTTSADVSGPSSSTDNALPRFEGTGGKTLQASDAILDDSENLSGLASVAGAADAAITFQADTDVNFRVDADADSFSTFNFKNGGNSTIASINEAGKLVLEDDIQIKGDDLTMGTNTSGHILVADGTNYNPVAVSGDVTINSSGAVSVSSSLAGLTTIGAAGATTNFAAGDVTIYNPVTDGNPSLSLGKDASDRLLVTSTYNSGAQSLDKVEFSAITSSATADDGRIIFDVDGVDIVTIDDGGIESYIEVADANPSLKMGSSAAESLSITSTFDSGTQNLDSVEFATATADTGADEGRIIFDVDGTDIATIDDGGLSLSASKGLDVAGTAILADSSGTMTLSNVDALDATTEATTEAAIDTLANLTSLGAAGATTNVAAGDVTFYNPVTGGNPSLSLGSSSAERLSIVATYDSSAQTLDNVEFATAAASGTDDKGKMVFDVDGTNILQVDDAGLDILVDAGQIGFGADSEIVLSHDADDGLDIKHTATGDDKPVKLVLKTGETDIAFNDVLGAINFQAPDEVTGTDAILVAAGIEAVSEGDFSSSSNATKLSFKTASSAAAAETMSLSSGGNLTVAGTIQVDGNIIKASDGGSTITLDNSDNVAIAGNLKVVGNIIQNSEGTTTLTMDTDEDLTIAGDLTVSGNDLFMGTNTSGNILVANGTDFSPVAMSGDVAIASNGATTIQANSVALGTDTAGAYVASATTNGGLSVVGSDDAITMGIAYANVTADGDAGATGDSIMIFDTNNSEALKRITLAQLDTLIDTNTMGSGFVLEDHSGDEVTITEDKEVKFIAGAGITINWTDVDTGDDSDPYDLSFSVDTSSLLPLSGGTMTGNIEFDLISGDPAIVFDTDNADKFTLGVDDSDNDLFKINSGATLGDPSDFEMDSSGNVTTAGTVTATGLVVSDDGNIGSASDTDAIAISNTGVVSLSSTAAASATDTAALKLAGGLGVALDIWAGNDLVLDSDAAVIKFGENQDIELTHSADVGLNIKHTATGAGTPVKLTLQTGETDIAASDVIGAINFQAPDESTGTDAILVAAGIEAVAEDTFDGTTNKAKLSFKTGASEAATEKMSLSSAGVLTLSGTAAGIVIPDAQTIGSASDTDAIKIYSGGRVDVTDEADASATNTAALVVSGGAGIGKDIWVGDDVVLDSDAAVIQFGEHQEVTLTHDADDGLALKHTATADDKPVKFILQTGETDIEQDDVIGAINFQAPDESTGTDAILVAAGIEAVSEGDFSTSNNATKLSFKTGASEAAAEKMSLSSGGNLTVSGTVAADGCTPGSGDCGIVLSDNTGGTPGAPGTSNQTKLHTKGGDLYVLPNGGTSPGGQVVTSNGLASTAVSVQYGTSGPTYYYPFWGHSDTVTDEDRVASATPVEIVVSKITCVLAGDAQGSGDGRTLTLVDDGSDTALSCLVEVGALTCSDTGSVTVAAGSEIYYKSVEQGSMSGHSTITCFAYYTE